ncbi:hypothetical protein KUW04_08130 [Halomonas denitrificans]|nr:hypothetical protein [Halomonas denitrificans]
MPTLKTAVIPLVSVSLLAACANSPSPNHQFYTESGPDGLHFTLVHYSDPDTEAKARPAPPQADNGRGSRRGGGGKGGERERGGRERGTPPPSDTASSAVPQGGIDDHTLMALLEQELDQRQLCLDGYRILEQRPTQRGVLLRGHCL